MFWIVIYSLLAVIVLKIVYTHLQLRHVPGPRFASWSPLWQLRGALSGRYHEILGEVADEYGPLARIGPKLLLCTDVKVLRRMSSVRSTYTKGDFYDSGMVVPGKHNVVSMRDEASHKSMRAEMAPGFSGRKNGVYSFEPAIDRQIRNFITLLDEKYISTAGKPVPCDSTEKTQFFALDAISDVSFGAAFGYLQADHDLYDYNAINASSLPVINVVSVLPWLTKIIHKWPFNLALPKEDDQIGFGRLMGFATKLVDERLDAGSEDMEDMMQIHIHNGMSRDDLVQQVFLAVIAGSNSTAHALQMTIFSLINTPPAYRKLLEEIDAAKLSPGDVISWLQFEEQPYLRAVILEGLRLWPPVVGLGSKQVPPGGDVINGYFVPGGTQIGQNFYGIGRSKVIWGDDANVFRPERWIEAEGEQLKRMHEAGDTVFGYGKYVCLGKQIAMMELHKAVFMLLRRYDFSILDMMEPMKTQASVFMMASAFRVRVTRRTV